MKIHEVNNGHYVSLIIEGELDANSSVILDEKIATLLSEEKVNLHINGAGIQYISSPGLGVFISYVGELGSKGGKFVISSLAANVENVFQILGLDKLENLIIVNDESEVEAHFR
ncbi:MAG: STAS domain-containing protein [Bacteroidota bacterium]